MQASLFAGAFRYNPLRACNAINNGTITVLEVGEGAGQSTAGVCATVATAGVLAVLADEDMTEAAEPGPSAGAPSVLAIIAKLG
jgi:hypothetical protein